MVLKKRQEYGFLGYQIPVIPRAPRSQRTRSLKKKSVDDSQLCAFELLAAVAGKLLQESESSASSNATEGKVQLSINEDGTKKEQVEEKAARLECLDQESCIESVIVPESAAPECNTKSTLKEFPHVETNSISEHISVVTDSDLLNKVRCDVKYTRNSATGSSASKSEERFHADEQLCDLNLGDEAHIKSDLLGKQTGHLNVANCSSSKDPRDYRVNNTNKHSEGSIKFPLYRDRVPGASFPRHRNDVKIVNRDDDDDENYFRSNQLNTKIKASRPQSSTGYRRMKKFMTSRYWRTAPKLKDCEFINTGRGGRPIYHKRKTIYAREGYQHEVHSKRRRLYDHRQLYHYRSAVAYDHQASSESISNSSEKAMKGDKRGTPALHSAIGVSSSEIGHKASIQAMDPCGVKFSIKSFKVPELYIEVPETATVGSLKRTVMEAVNAILEGGLRVGVVLQGKNVGDDNRTLQQIGISQNEVLDSLGFTLEPNFVQATSPLSHKDPALLLPCDKHHGLPRSQVPILDSGFSNSSFDQVPVTNLANLVESNQEIVPYLTDVSTKVLVPDSKALVSITPLKANPLAIVAVNQKVKQSDLSQRRTRRPFSVSEVEALVEAVEKLGTGRWRDVKMRSFNDVNHRTYVDLKDKWKTLVHTASIAPQQRRGEPVPQELLDRVLAAHAYWSRHQSKQHGKHQIEPPLKLAGEVGV